VFARCPAAGPRLVAELLAEAREEGLSEWTLRRARERLGVRVRHTGFGRSVSWVWECGRESQEDGAVDAARIPHSTNVTNVTNVSNVLGKKSSAEPTAAALFSGELPEV
jgi:hypothetical protein